MPNSDPTMITEGWINRHLDRGFDAMTSKTASTWPRRGRKSAYSFPLTRTDAATKPIWMTRPERRRNPPKDA